jgi:hypothetical protein
MDPTKDHAPAPEFRAIAKARGLTIRDTHLVFATSATGG